MTTRSPGAPTGLGIDLGRGMTLTRDAFAAMRCGAGDDQDAMVNLAGLINQASDPRQLLAMLALAAASVVGQAGMADLVASPVSERDELLARDARQVAACFWLPGSHAGRALRSLTDGLTPFRARSACQIIATFAGTRASRLGRDLAVAERVFADCILDAHNIPAMPSPGRAVTCRG